MSTLQKKELAALQQDVAAAEARREFALEQMRAA